MNERIRELAEQAENYAYSVAVGGDECQEAYTKKFAELIVRECIEKALEERVNEDLIDQEHDIEDRCYLRGSNGGIIDAVCAIKQHFGVEE